MKRCLSVTLALALALLALCVAPSSAEGALRGQAGADVSGFTSVCLDGSAIDGGAFAQHPLSIVTYWATWSGDALRQLEYLQSVHEQRPDIGVYGLLHVDGTSTAQAAAAYMEAHGYTFTVFTVDEVWQGVVSGAAYMPQSFFVSTGGVVLQAWPGAFSSASAILGAAEQWVGPQGTWNVRFFDGFEGSCVLLASYLGVEDGASVEAPAAPMHEGFRFIGWSTGDYLCVEDNIDVFAVYAMLPDGDVDGNGMLNSLDALLLLRVVLGIEPMSPYYVQHGDMDMDGELTGLDALALMRIAMGIVGA